MHFENNVPPRGTESNWRIPHWCSFVLGGVFTFLLVYIGIARPAAHEVSLIKRQMSTLEQSVWQVAGQEETAKNANRLLSLLVEQKTIADQAASTLARMQELNRELAAESTKADRALATVQELISLKDAVVANSAKTEKATKVVADSISLHNQLASAASTTAEAIHSSAQLLAIGSELRASNDEIDLAKQTLSEMRSLHKQIDDEASNVATAQLKVDSLLSMKDSIIAETGNLADAIETLELTNDLTNRFQNASVTFEHMRRWMVEVVTMESILKRAQDALEPLTEIGNLRHLNVDQLRAVARNMSRGYETKVAQKPKSARDLRETSVITLDSDDLTLTDSLDIE